MLNCFWLVVGLLSTNETTSNFFQSAFLPKWRTTMNVRRRKFFAIFQKPTTIKEIPSSKKQSEIERKRKYEQDARQRKFQATWLKEFEWLVYDYKPCTMRCKICNKFETVGSFVTGTNFFRKDSIKAHEDSNSHCMNVKKKKVNLIRKIRKQLKHYQNWMKKLYLSWK
jgi:hypothetical protein